MVEQAFSPGISGTHLVFVLVDHRHIYSGNIGVSEKGRGWRVEEWREKERRGRRGEEEEDRRRRREGGKERREEEGENEVSKLKWV